MLSVEYPDTPYVERAAQRLDAAVDGRIATLVGSSNPVRRFVAYQRCGIATSYFFWSFAPALVTFWRVLARTMIA